MADGDALIIGADGETTTVPNVPLSERDARLLREYRKFLQRHRLREALTARIAGISTSRTGARRP